MAHNIIVEYDVKTFEELNQLQNIERFLTFKYFAVSMMSLLIIICLALLTILNIKLLRKVFGKGFTAEAKRLVFLLIAFTTAYVLKAVYFLLYYVTTVKQNKTP